MDMSERDRAEFFYCKKDDTLFSKAKFPPGKTGFLGGGDACYKCPLCGSISEDAVEAKGGGNGEED